MPREDFDRIDEIHQVQYTATPHPFLIWLRHRTKYVYDAFNRPIATLQYPDAELHSAPSSSGLSGGGGRCKLRADGWISRPGPSARGHRRWLSTIAIHQT